MITNIINVAMMPIATVSFGCGVKTSCEITILTANPITVTHMNLTRSGIEMKLKNVRCTTRLQQVGKEIAEDELILEKANINNTSSESFPDKKMPYWELFFY